MIIRSSLGGAGWMLGSAFGGRQLAGADGAERVAKDWHRREGMGDDRDRSLRPRSGQALGLGSRMQFAPTGAPLTFENGQMERMQEAHLGEIFHQPETCMTKVGFHLGQ